MIDPTSPLGDTLRELIEDLRCGSYSERHYSSQADCERFADELAALVRAVPLGAAQEDTQELTPLKNPLGDGHHTDEPFTAEDTYVGDRLAYFMGTLENHFDNADKLWQWWYRERTSVSEWMAVARALRIHGLRIVNRHVALPPAACGAASQEPMCVCGCALSRHYDHTDEGGTSCWVQFCACEAFTLAPSEASAAVRPQSTTTTIHNAVTPETMARIRRGSGAGLPQEK